jgi:hypothetical protein
VQPVKVQQRPRIPTSGEPPDSGTRTGGSPLFVLEDMTMQRMDNVAIVVEDLDGAVAFFTELGVELEGKGQAEGRWADPTVGLDGVRSDIAMMRTPDGHSKLELTKCPARMRSPWRSAAAPSWR